MLPRSSRLLLRTPPPSAILTRLSQHLAPPSSSSAATAPLRRSFAHHTRLLSAKRDWENQAGTKPGSTETSDQTDPDAVVAPEVDLDQQPGESTTTTSPSDDVDPASSPSEKKSPKKPSSKKTSDTTKVEEGTDSAVVHEGVVPPTSTSPSPSSADTSSAPSSTDPTSPAEVKAKLATKVRTSSKAGVVKKKNAGSSSAVGASSTTTTASNAPVEEFGGEDGLGGTGELHKFDHTLVLPVTSSMLPPYHKNFTFTEPSVIRAVRSLASHNIDQLGVFLLKPKSSSSSSTSTNPEQAPENVDVISSSSEVYTTGLLCRIKSSRPGSVIKAGEGEQGEETVTSWNVELEPVRRIKLDGVEVGKEVEGKVEEVKQESELGAVVEEGEEGDVASFEKVESSTSSTVTTTHNPLDVLRSHAVSIGSITHVEYVEPDMSDTTTKELHAMYVQDLKDWAGKSPQDVQSSILELSQSSGLDFFTRRLGDQLDIVAGLAPHATNKDRQDVLDAVDIAERLRAVNFIMKKELYDIDVRNKIHREMKARLDERQKEMILGEQMRAIKKELGHDKGNGKDELVDKLRAQAEGLRMPDEVAKTFEAEMSKLAMLDQNSSEFNVVRNYLDWIVSVPWGKRTVDSFSIPSSIKILNEDHYGLTDVKDRILEFLAVGKLRGTVEGKILCLVGPPGVGKTSIAKSIARALDRKFYRISVGGLRDVAEIKGHRRTYVAAMPGKAVQALKQTQAENPLILIDEIDKMSGGGGGGGSWGGDPSSALLEMLDPEQNGAFTDHYLDLPVDLSKVLFVCTANMLSTIPAPLLDRMEVLEVSGYVSEEKKAIAKGYLSPQAKKASGLEKADVEIEDSAVTALIQYYCRESGVRNLKKHIEKIYRKSAFKIVKDLPVEETSAEHPAVEVEAAYESTAAAAQGAVPEPAVSSATLNADASASSVTSGSSSESQTLPAGTTTLNVVKPLEVPASVSMRITKDNLKDYVGPPVYQKDRIYPFAPPPGVSNGLGYTGNGAGALMPIEITVMPGKGSIQTTGKLGDVIKESVNIAISYLRANAFALGIAVKETDIVLGGSSDRDIHLHMPEGAIGKDGPSAGVAILTALVSLMTKTRVDPDIAMTGEITLGGQVLPVGGLKEKILAAHRANIKKLLIPQACQGDVEENVHASVKEGIDIVYVSNVREVLYEVFGQLPVAESWKDKYPLLELYGTADVSSSTPNSTISA